MDKRRNLKPALASDGTPKRPPANSPVKATGSQQQRQQTDYSSEDVLEHARVAFAETVGLKVQQLRRFIPKAKDRTNTQITGNFIEELVRGFITKWIGQQLLVTGAFFNKECEDSDERAMQIDGIVHDPRRGPAIIKEGNFEIVHPAFCSGVIEIKITHGNLQTLEQRLQEISRRYMHHLTASHVMGVIISSPNPEKDSQILLSNGQIRWMYNAQVGWCPIFILFKEQNGEYKPHFNAIHRMIVALWPAPRNWYQMI
jgi:hypothetical protein